MAIGIRRTALSDLAYVTALERRADHLDWIGQWTDDQHRAAIAGKDRWSHWMIERDGSPAGYLIARDCRIEEAGIYIKRILVADKERGAGQAALKAFIDCFRADTDRFWLIVRNENARAQAVYLKLGFARFDPIESEARVFDAIAEAPPDRGYRMLLTLSSPT